MSRAAVAKILATLLVALWWIFDPLYPDRSARDKLITATIILAVTWAVILRERFLEWHRARDMREKEDKPDV